MVPFILLFLFTPLSLSDFHSSSSSSPLLSVTTFSSLYFLLFFFFLIFPFPFFPHSSIIFPPPLFPYISLSSRNFFSSYSLAAASSISFFLFLSFPILSLLTSSNTSSPCAIRVASNNGPYRKPARHVG